MDIYAQRRKHLAAWLKSNTIEAALLEDMEGCRDPSLKYFSGHPGDALLVLMNNGTGILVPWDINMAKLYASVDECIPYSEFSRSKYKALEEVLKRYNVKHGSQIELPASTSYPSYIDFSEALEPFDLVCRNDGVGKKIIEMRAVKDQFEIANYRKASAITNDLIDKIEHFVRNGELSTEMDVALFIERELRNQGAERVGFETIAAGPSRSFGIHAFPLFTAKPFGSEGLSILDFGVVVDGYTTDVTMTFVKGSTKGKRGRMIELVKQAYDECIALCTPGKPVKEISKHVDAIFMKDGLFMPHGLGHGIGLEAHEAPIFRNREDNYWKLEQGNIITIEPGLYDLEEGGVRLENDLLITENGYEILTNSRIVML